MLVLDILTPIFLMLGLSKSSSATASLLNNFEIVATSTVAFIAGQYTVNIAYILVALSLGFVAYGLSVYLYIYAQRNLGAARTSVYYAFAPFIGVGLSFIIFREIPTTSYLIAFGIMVLGAYLTAFEKHQHSHIHN